MIARRLPDWRSRLGTYVAGAAATRYRPGRHDCALFAAGAVAAMTGSDPAAPWRGRYTTLRGGFRVLRRAGYRDHLALVTATLAPCPPSFARAGDLAAVPGEAGLALGVVQGERIYVLRETGLATVDLLQAVAAWRVP
ncbi:MAG: hypothetical protein KF887_07150 [Paracoccaceae bacterium]|nr:MAG: hypothetical protein KF887_07150 [Paracoccaceae bacterium]